MLLSELKNCKNMREGVILLTGLHTNLIAISMTSNNNALGPSRDQSWNVLANNGFPKHGASQNIPDGSIWRLPHLFQVEF